MTNVKIETIIEIAEQLDCGFRVFMHKTTEQLLSVPNTNEMQSIDLDGWEEEFEELDNNIIDYYEIDKWTSRDAFDIMIDFTEQLTENIPLQDRLFDSLHKNKPFREFKHVIDHSGIFRQKWFDFKNKQQQDFVVRQLDRILPSLTVKYLKS